MRKAKHKWANRVLSFIMALAMIVTMAPTLPGGKMEAHAAGSVKLYFELPENTSATDWAVNAWNDVTVSGDSAHAFRPTNWGEGATYPTLLADDNLPGWGYVTVSGTVEGLQFVNLEGKEYKCWNAQITAQGYDTAYYSTSDKVWYADSDKTQEIKEAEVQNIFVLVGDAGLAGSAWNNTDTSNVLVQSTSNENIYSITFESVPVGKYEYQILQDPANKGWELAWGGKYNRCVEVSAPADVTFTIDLTDTSYDIKVTCKYVKDLVVDVAKQIKKDSVLTLPSTGIYYDGEGNKSEVPVTYTPVSEGVTVSGTTLTVPNSYTGTDATVKATCNGFEKNITIPVVEKLYTYTIYYYDFNPTHMATDATDLWLWQEGGAGGVAYTFSGTEEKDGNTWLKATVTVPFYDNIRIIPRSAGAWNWQNDTISYDNTTQAENTTIYLTSNSKEAYTSIPDLVPPRERYVLVEYDRPEADYEGWNIFTWNSGFGNSVSVPVEELGGKMVAKVPVKDSTADLMLSFCMRRSEPGKDWAKKDGGDHYVNVPANQTVVKAKFVQDQGITEVLPYNTGYQMDGANGKIHFYYRDDVLAANNNLASLNGKVSITVNGTVHDMTYDAATDRFVYDLSGIEPGDYYYYYTINGEKQLDAFNGEKGTYNSEECSKCTYKKYDMTISAEMSQSSMDYNDNNVLKVKCNPAAGQSMAGFEVANASVDLSALGLSSTQAINTELMELSIACKDTTTTGVKTLPVTVTDIYGNVYTTNASVTVTARDKSNGDFDWDEAVIYFAVTDRFFDGNASNNDAYGVGDYNTGEDGGSSYHGGDFAGLNAKLDYLQDLGVNTIWITPIVENIIDNQPDSKTGFGTYGYHGYWASDFTELNKHLGTKEEFKALLDAAHSRNMKIMVDVVLNHAGYGTEDYFNSIVTAEDGSAIDMIRDSGNTVSGDDKLDSLSGLPDFVTENEEVRNQLIEWQTDWMDEFDIDYYRVDTVKHVDNTTWAAFKNSLTKVNPDFKMIGEYAGAGYANTAGELGTGSMDSLLDFDFNGWAKEFLTGGISKIEENLQKRNGAINNTATMGSFLSSHDEDSLQYTLVNESGLSETEAYNLMKVAATLQITAKGQPVIYYGEEIGQAGANNWPYQTNRRDFDWAELEKQKTDSNSIYNHYKNMLKIRNDYSKVFAKGDRATVLQSDADGYEVISRSYGVETLYVGMNITGTAKNVVIPVSAEAGTVLTNLYDGKEYTVSADKKISITIPEAKNGGTIVLGEKKENADVRTVIPVSGNDFTEVIDTINEVEDGTTITIIMPDTDANTAVVPAEVFNAISNRDVTVNIQVSDVATWIVNGNNVKNNVTTPIDLGVTMGSSSIPTNKIKALAGDNNTLEISLAHDGAFGFDASLNLKVGTENSGKYANLYYYNESTGKLEYTQACKVNADGTVTFEFTHASEYVIVFSDTDMNPVLASGTQNTTTTATTQTTTTQTTASAPKTGDTSPIGLYVVLLFVGGAAVVVVTRRKRKKA
ncbi:alpha-amylase family glycosyl hydrolase [Roseburia sp. 499]|uniref:alpha-amylase family glycosyl hydrolase n=1 Tax=Roseburia sp. 499 TaxID=1261634 RepID=UPI000B10260F|nr:alpha-amylase family glycosyl hydrolase [Roseburia sp. 499]WVK68782.1 alpha-amylase family glycosyl hydrolase [Roseburia sp. 499]